MGIPRCRPVVIAGVVAAAAIAVLLAGPATMAADPFEVIATSTNKEPIALKATPAEVALALPPDGAERLATKPGQKLYLMITSLRTNAQPEVLYEVFLGLPPGIAPERGSIHFVGTFNFFNAETGTPAGGTDRSRFFSYEVTDLIRALQTRNLLGDTLTVTIVPSAKPNVAAAPVVGEVTLVRQ
jgi:tyrosinase